MFSYLAFGNPSNSSHDTPLNSTKPYKVGGSDDSNSYSVTSQPFPNPHDIQEYLPYILPSLISACLIMTSLCIAIIILSKR